MLAGLGNAESPRPRGVTAVAVVFLSASGYLLVIGLIKLISPEAIPLSLGAPFLHGLELWGPYMFLLTAGLGVGVGFGILRLKNVARRAAIAIAVAGMVMLVPTASADASDLSVRFFLTGSMIVVRAMIVWYLWQRWTVELFN